MLICPLSRSYKWVIYRGTRGLPAAYDTQWIIPILMPCMDPIFIAKKRGAPVLPFTSASTLTQESGLMLSQAISGRNVWVIDGEIIVSVLTDCSLGLILQHQSVIPTHQAYFIEAHAQTFHQVSYSLCQNSSKTDVLESEAEKCSIRRVCGLDSWVVTPARGDQGWHMGQTQRAAAWTDIFIAWCSPLFNWS